MSCSKCAELASREFLECINWRGARLVRRISCFPQFFTMLGTHPQREKERQRAYGNTRTHMPNTKNSNALIGFAVRLFVSLCVLLQLFLFGARVSIWFLLIGKLIYNELRCAPTQREQRSSPPFPLQGDWISASRETPRDVRRTIFVLSLAL